MASRLERRLAKLERNGRDAEGKKHPGFIVMHSREEYEAAREAGQLPSRGLIIICPKAPTEETRK
jgi:hypothetical protein